jgi:polyribonucleotide nucleotidyltransferase
MHHVGHRRVEYHLYLELIHGNAHCRDHMAEVGNFSAAKGAFGTLHEQQVFLQRDEDEAHVLEVLRLGTTVDEDVVEEDQDEVAQIRLEHFVHERLDGGRHVR